MSKDFRNVLGEENFTTAVKSREQTAGKENRGHKNGENF